MQSRPAPGAHPAIHRCWRLGKLFIAGAGLTLAATAMAAVEVDAPPALKDFLKAHLQAPAADARDATLEAYSREVRHSVAELLATEGYFSPAIQVRAAPGQLSVTVAPGAATIVSNVSIAIRGDIADQRREALRADWPLRKGQPFRSAAWSEAKQLLLRRLLEIDYPSARLLSSRAQVDPQAAEAELYAEYDSGPRYVFGGLRISGLSRYSPDLIHRYNKIAAGSRYDAKELLALQAALQRTSYFSSVSVEIAHPENPPEQGPVEAEIDVNVDERAPHRLSFGIGVSSNTGANAEIIYQSFDFLHRGWQLDAGLRLEQLRQSLYADIRLPPQGERRDSFGALADTEDIQSLKRHRVAVGAVRTVVRGTVEVRYALNWQRETREPWDAPSTANDALVLDGTWTVHRVDDVLNPRHGFISQLQVGGAAKAVLSDQNFLRLHGRHQHFFPLARSDVLSLRGELGATLASSREGIPQDFLFRTGGSQSVRGYAYQGLGVQEGNAVVGGRYLAVASAEYTHWLNARWGGAAFIDAGNAVDDRRKLKLAVGYGLGARWKSPAGPLAVDLAYGEEDKRVRLHFSMAVAF